MKLNYLRLWVPSTSSHVFVIQVYYKKYYEIYVFLNILNIINNYIFVSFKNRSIDNLQEIKIKLTFWKAITNNNVLLFIQILKYTTKSHALKQIHT